MFTLKQGRGGDIYFLNETNVYRYLSLLISINIMYLYTTLYSIMKYIKLLLKTRMYIDKSTIHFSNGNKFCGKMIVLRGLGKIAKIVFTYITELHYPRGEKRISSTSKNRNWFIFSVRKSVLLTFLLQDKKNVTF